MHMENISLRLDAAHLDFAVLHQNLVFRDIHFGREWSQRLSRHGHSATVARLSVPSRGFFILAGMAGTHSEHFDDTGNAQVVLHGKSFKLWVLFMAKIIRRQVLAPIILASHLHLLLAEDDVRRCATNALQVNDLWFPFHLDKCTPVSNLSFTAWNTAAVLYSLYIYIVLGTVLTHTNIIPEAFSTTLRTRSQTKYCTCFIPQNNVQKIKIWLELIRNNKWLTASWGVMVLEVQVSSLGNSSLHKLDPKRKNLEFEDISPICHQAWMRRSSSKPPNGRVSLVGWKSIAAYLPWKSKSLLESDIGIISCVALVGKPG